MAKKNSAGADTAPIVYTVLEPLLHNGDLYAVGETIELDQAAATPLLANRTLSATGAALDLAVE